LLGRLPEGAVRDNQEVDLQMALSWSLYVASGPREPERESALVRARELCERLGDNNKPMDALLGLAHMRANLRDFELARELGEMVVAMAQQAGAPAVLARAHALQGIVRFSTGQFPAAREHFERAVDLFGAGSSCNEEAYFAENPRASLRVPILGYPLTSLSKADELPAAARRGSDPNATVIHLFGNLLSSSPASRHQHGGGASRPIAVYGLRMRDGVPFDRSTFFRGWAMAAVGRGKEGLAEMRRSISDPMFAEAASTAQMLVVLAETCGKNGRPKEGLDLVINALATAEQTGQKLTEWELHRLKGELLMLQDPSNVAEPERCLRTAIDVARRQSARLFELRAAVSLARLLRETNRAEEARAMLAEIFGWFTEGFETVDLKEAKALFEDLREERS
jgi:tetratricopeptide (TPR) repeat protein